MSSMTSRQRMLAALDRQEPDHPPCSFMLFGGPKSRCSDYESESAPALALARELGLLVAGGWGVGADLIGWNCGLDQMIFLPYDQPQFFQELLDLIAAWNRSRMETVLAAGIDLYIKRAWYENLDFFTPASWQRFIFPILKIEADLAHGAHFGDLITANCMPLLEQFAEAGVDVLIGVDPHRWDIAAAKARIGSRVCLWGGVNGHLTVEMGMPAQVRAEVRRAMQVLAPGGGFILSPVDNIREATPQAWANVHTLIDEWRRHTLHTVA